MDEAFVCPCGSVTFHILKCGLIECSGCSKHIEAKWEPVDDFNWVKLED